MENNISYQTQRNGRIFSNVGMGLGLALPWLAPGIAATLAPAAPFLLGGYVVVLGVSVIRNPNAALKSVERLLGSKRNARPPSRKRLAIATACLAATAATLGLLLPAIVAGGLIGALAGRAAGSLCDAAASGMADGARRAVARHEAQIDEFKSDRVRERRNFDRLREPVASPGQGRKAEQSRRHQQGGVRAQENFAAGCARPTEGTREGNVTRGAHLRKAPEQGATRSHLRT